ncbi:MAG: hypothetical protein DDT24_00238 [Chloroflexi bacterium]|nr:hypothetical protein [Chloroflexota bacterium]
MKRKTSTIILGIKGEVPIMPVVANIVKCKKCGFEIRSDWKHCPNCADKIVCVGKYRSCEAEA